MSFRPGVDQSSRADLPSPVESLPDMRAAAKWIIGAMASVGAFTLGGLPLAAVGRVHTPTEAVAFAAGMMIALAGVGVAVWFTAEALVPPVTTMDTFARSDLGSLRNAVAESPEAFFGPFGRSPTDLRQAYAHHFMLASEIRRRLRQERDSDRRAAWSQALEDSAANIALIASLQDRLVQLIHVWQVREALRRARRATMIGACLIVLGIAIALIATS